MSFYNILNLTSKGVLRLRRSRTIRSRNTVLGFPIERDLPLEYVGEISGSLRWVISACMLLLSFHTKTLETCAFLGSTRNLINLAADELKINLSKNSFSGLADLSRLPANLEVLLIHTNNLCVSIDTEKLPNTL